MPKESGTVEQPTVTAPEPPKSQLIVNDAEAVSYYSATSRVWGSSEEVIIDFSQGIRPTNQPNTAVLKIDSRVIMSPWAAKRLAIALSQTVQRYEQVYGPLELDPQKRQKAAPPKR